MDKNLKKNKSDKSKEILIKCLIIFILIIEFVGFIIAPIVLISLRNETLTNIAVIVIFSSMFISFISLIAVFSIGSTLKNSNSKDYKILKYNCCFEGDLKERFFEIFGENVKKIGDDKLLYTFYVNGNDLKEVTIIVCYTVDEFFCEREYISKIEQIPEVYGDYFSHTMCVIFEETLKSEYLYKIMHSPEYGTANDRLLFCVYDQENKILSVNKTKDPTGSNATFYKIKRELNKIFNFQAKQ